MDYLDTKNSYIWMYGSKTKVLWLDLFGVFIEIKENIKDFNVCLRFFRTKSYDSITSLYFCIAFFNLSIQSTNKHNENIIM